MKFNFAKIIMQKKFYLIFLINHILTSLILFLYSNYMKS
jgi:hypothetical protein